MKTKLRKKVFAVPVFDVTVVLIVTSDIPAAYKKELGEEIEDTAMALVAVTGKTFCMFLEPEAASRPEVIAHEVFHLTHRILEFCEMNFDAEHHEVGAYLCEYLTKTVHHTLKN